MILSTHLLADVEAVCREILVLKNGELLSRQVVDSHAREPRQVFEVEGFGGEEGFLAGLEEMGAEVMADGRLHLVTLDLSQLIGKIPGADRPRGFRHRRGSQRHPGRGRGQRLRPAPPAPPTRVPG